MDAQGLYSLNEFQVFNKAVFPNCLAFHLGKVVAEAGLFFKKMCSRKWREGTPIWQLQELQQAKSCNFMCLYPRYEASSRNCATKKIFSLFTPSEPTSSKDPPKTGYAKVKHIVAVSSCKGGVGKSSVASAELPNTPKAETRVGNEGPNMSASKIPTRLSNS